MLVMFIVTSVSVHKAFTMLPKHPQEEKQSQRHKRQLISHLLCGWSLPSGRSRRSRHSDPGWSQGPPARHTPVTITWGRWVTTFIFKWQVTMLAQTLIHCQRPRCRTPKRDCLEQSYFPSISHDGEICFSFSYSSFSFTYSGTFFHWVSYNS